MAELEFTYKMDISFSSDVLKHCYSLRCIPFDNEFGAKALSKRFGVAPQTISAVITKQNWSDFNCAGELITWR